MASFDSPSSETPLGAATMEESTTTPAITRLKGLLRQPLRVTVKDGRIFLGTFVGTDDSLNIILVSTEEYRMPQEGGSHHSRYVGQVMIPWNLVTKAEAESHWEDRLVGLSDEALA